MSDDLDDEDAYAIEGVQAFNHMTTAMHGLDGRLGALDVGLGTKVAAAEKAASIAATAAQNAKQAAEQLHAATRAKARSHAAWAVLGALAGILVAGGAGCWVGQSSGWQAGQAAGYAMAVDEKAAASWANTPSGRRALAMDQAGGLALVTTCTGQGWTTETVKGHRVCYPRALKDGSLYGWALP